MSAFCILVFPHVHDLLLGGEEEECEEVEEQHRPEDVQVEDPEEGARESDSERLHGLRPHLKLGHLADEGSVLPLVREAGEGRRLVVLLGVGVWWSVEEVQYIPRTQGPPAAARRARAASAGKCRERTLPRRNPVEGGWWVCVWCRTRVRRSSAYPDREHPCPVEDDEEGEGEVASHGVGHLWCGCGVGV